MKLVGPTLALAALSLLCTPRALAGEHQTQLASCLVQSTTPQDREALVQWIFVAMASHPMARELANVPDDKRKATTARATAVFEKLMTDACGTETFNTVKYEGTESLGKAFETLGGVAMEGLMSHPDVQKAVTDMTSGLDQKKFEALFNAQGK